MSIYIQVYSCSWTEKIHAKASTNILVKLYCIYYSDKISAPFLFDDRDYKEIFQERVAQWSEHSMVVMAIGLDSPCVLVIAGTLVSDMAFYRLLKILTKQGRHEYIMQTIFSLSLDLVQLVKGLARS